MHLPLFLVVLCWYLFWYALLFCKHLDEEKRALLTLVALLLLSFGCLVAVNVLWLFITVPWVGLQFVIMVFPDHTHLLFNIFFCKKWRPRSEAAF